MNICLLYTSKDVFARKVSDNYFDSNLELPVEGMDGNYVYVGLFSAYGGRGIDFTKVERDVYKRQVCVLSLKITPLGKDVFQETFAGNETILSLIHIWPIPGWFGSKRYRGCRHLFRRRVYGERTLKKMLRVCE